MNLAYLIAYLSDLNVTMNSGIKKLDRWKVDVELMWLSFLHVSFVIFKIVTKAQEMG